MASLLSSAAGLLRQLTAQAAADAARKADPGLRTAADHLVAVLATVLAVTLVLGSIALGWLVLWRTTLSKIGMFRDMMGLNKVQQAESKRRAQLEIESLKRQLSQQHASFGRHLGAEDEGEGYYDQNGNYGYEHKMD